MRRSRGCDWWAAVLQTSVITQARRVGKGKVQDPFVEGFEMIDIGDTLGPGFLEPRQGS